MPRKPRVQELGFYHIVNRGVARTNIFESEKDYLKFLEIAQDASTEYRFEIYSFSLLRNHYHFLLKTFDENLSAAMQKINSRYSVYFNNKYKRVGPLWQGRFKSWFVFDVGYLSTLVRYIEFNPVKANIANKIGEYKWAMSSRNVELKMLNFELIEKTNFDKELSDNELKQIDELYSAKVKIKNDAPSQKKRQPLKSYFIAYTKESAIYRAAIDGYKQNEIGQYLGVSNVAISKTIKIYKQKVKLFEKLRDKGIFWSYSKDIEFDDMADSIVIEHLLKYGDFDDIKSGFALFGKNAIKKVWLEKLKSDPAFIKTNLLIARVFLGMDVESSYFKGVKNARFEKLKMLAS